MRLSEAIQLGAMMTSQAFRTLFKGDAACALGAALLAVGVAPEQAGRSVRKRWPWAFAVPERRVPIRPTRQCRRRGKPKHLAPGGVAGMASYAPFVSVR